MDCGPAGFRDCLFVCLFQTLIGTVGTLAACARFSQRSLSVSNPYRYGRNSQLPSFFPRLHGVSNPYRYGRNLEKLQVIPGPGPVSNPYRYGRNVGMDGPLSWVDSSFQTLIGTVGTWAFLPQLELESEFQTLIGTVGTRGWIPGVWTTRGFKPL